VTADAADNSDPVMDNMLDSSRRLFSRSSNKDLQKLGEEEEGPEAKHDPDYIFLGWSLGGEELLEQLVQKKLDLEDVTTVTDARTRALREFKNHVGQRRAEVYMDRSSADILFIGGSRGSGKSYNLRAITNRSAEAGVTNIVIDVENEFYTNNIYQGIQSGPMRNLRENEQPKNIDTKVLMPYFVYQARRQKDMAEKGYDYMDVFKFDFAHLTPDDIGYLVQKMGDHRDYTLFSRAIERRMRTGRDIKTWDDVIAVAEELDAEDRFRWGNGERVREIKDFIDLYYREYGVLGNDYNIDLKQILNQHDTIAISLHDAGNLPSDMQLSELYIALLVKNVRTLVERGLVDKPVHWAVDEADEWIPAENQDVYHPSRSQFEEVTLNDRKRGFRVTFATQKPGKIQQGGKDLSEDPFMGEAKQWLMPYDMKPGPRRKLLNASGRYQDYGEQWHHVFDAMGEHEWLYINQKQGFWTVLEPASPLAYHLDEDKD